MIKQFQTNHGHTRTDGKTNLYSRYRCGSSCRLPGVANVRRQQLANKPIQLFIRYYNQQGNTSIDVQS